MKNTTGVVFINNDPEGAFTISIGGQNYGGIIYFLRNIDLDSNKYQTVAVMITYQDGLSLFEHLEDADGKLTMTISKAVRSHWLIVNYTLSQLLFLY